ncbi:hypothetical protein CLF_113594 [Clonorchis sinensis]|uniref:Uncharacterized protein n=1 Tax=Clonorchis sinensis TaxID=79923 RepID=G7YYU8_CLOSI|nr:hypothetical protein CLF_113594 [Clonorchis sinensis]
MKMRGFSTKKIEQIDFGADSSAQWSRCPRVSCSSIALSSSAERFMSICSISRTSCEISVSTSFL